MLHASYHNGLDQYPSLTPAVFNQLELKTPHIYTRRDSAAIGATLECCRRPQDLPVAIIGGGAAGMRIAMMLDYLGISYEIFEASQRHGGRCYTYHFTREEESGLKHDYFDVGAMRFPQIPAMKSLFALFEELNITAEGGAGGRLVPVITNAPGNIWMYNGVKKDVEELDTPGDHFHDEEHNHGAIPKEYASRKFIKANGEIVYGAYACYSAALEPFAQALTKDAETGWERLLKYDTFSAKAFFLQVMQYPWAVIQWLEDRVSVGTGLFNLSFTEAVLDYLYFFYAPPSDCSGNNNERKWWCIDGGTEVLTNAMHKTLKSKPRYLHRVTSVSMSNRKDATTTMKIVVAGHPEFSDREYSHVVSTVPPPCLRTIDLSGCGLTYKQNKAIQFLEHVASLKIGIKFKTRWWQHDPKFTNQTGGASSTDRPIREVVYPSYGLDDAPDSPGVLIVAYSWGEDAIQLGSFIQDKVWGERLDPLRTPSDSETILLEQIYRDLAALHGQTPDWYKAETLDYYAYAWHNNPNTMGAFAYFGPGDFSGLYPSIIVPAAHGKFHFAGAAASMKHSWLAGGLDSAWRCVHEIVKENSPQRAKFLKKFAAASHGHA